ncbi:MAG: hypothetical protein WDN25_31035 [Acetobacteraceae bacterium]
MRSIMGRVGLALFALPMLALAARADTGSAAACAAQLPGDAKAIFDKTASQVRPTSDLRSLVTTNTRSLAISGSISRDTARQSATAAAQCLKQLT